MKIVVSTFLTIAFVGFVYFLFKDVIATARKNRKEDAVQKTLKKQPTKTKSK